MDGAELQPLNTKKVNKNTKKESWSDNIAYIKDNITIEPVLLCYEIAGALARLATQNLNLDKACRVNKNYGDVVCSALVAREGNQYLKEELAVQQLIAAMESWKNILLTAIPSLLILFLGAWSDRTGRRKICILLPIIGELFVCLSNILNVYFFYELPLEITMFFEAFIPGITGGWILIFMGVFSYIVDVSSEEFRTVRVGIANFCSTAARPIGSVLSGVLLKHIGYYGVFSICSILYIFSILYGIYYLEDPMESDNTKKDSSGVCGFLKSFFDVKHVKDTVQVAVKKGPNQRRTKCILILTSIAFTYGPSYGEQTVEYLYTRYKFSWDAVMYSFYGTLQIAGHCLGAIISISLFSHRLKWDDSVLGVISMCSKLLGALTTGLARNTIEMYIGVLLDILNATTYTALRSISSKMCTSDELGKKIAVFNLMEVLTSMVFGPIYSWIYMFTVKVEASIVYYVSTVLTIPALMIFIWFFIQHRKGFKLEQTEKNANTRAVKCKRKSSKMTFSAALTWPTRKFYEIN